MHGSPLRVEVRGLLGDSLCARQIEREVASIPGVQEVRANERTGAVLCFLEAPSATLRAAVLASLTKLSSADAPPPPSLRRLLRGEESAVAGARSSVYFKAQSPLEAGEVHSVSTEALAGEAGLSAGLDRLIEAGAMVLVMGEHVFVGSFSGAHADRVAWARAVGEHDALVEERPHRTSEIRLSQRRPMSRRAIKLASGI